MSVQPPGPRAERHLSGMRRAAAAIDRPAVVAGPGSAPMRTSPAAADLPTGVRGTGAALDEDLDRVLTALRTPAIWLDEFGAVVRAHPDVAALRLVRANRLRVPQISRMVAAANTSGEIVQEEVRLRRINPRSAEILLRVRVAPMSSGATLILVEDLSEAARLDNVRRDFVANVSHELKTPVGAISLLAEAIEQSRHEPEMVAHFAARMRQEANRLATLVSDLLDLSRLEGSDPMDYAVAVNVDGLVEQACDDVRLAAAAKQITLIRGGTAGLTVLGVPAQLVTALRNLVANAINYSPDGTKVAISTSVEDGLVSIAVTDQGIGIARAEMDRIFERFYRVDPARSRNTGGTGLGLAIVKHVCVNHGGDCTVWSKPREGSTFTMRLPELVEADLELAEGDPTSTETGPAADQVDRAEE